jgi:hypothetical protein
LGKPYEIHLTCYCEHFGEQHGEPFDKLIGTPWEHIKNNPKQSLPPPQKEKNNWISHECMLNLLIGCMKLSFPKLFIIIFGLG